MQFNRRDVSCFSMLTIFLTLGTLTLAGENWQPKDTREPGQHPPSPRESLEMLQLPAGFQITLAAGEPDVRQPIAIAFDDKGRLWVAESYSYDGSKFTAEPRDRILIFEDADGDGVFEKRTVFQDRLNRLTGLALGFGGVWVTTPPHLAWIPDRNGDDRPDGPPVVELDGWTLQAEHNSVNGLTWGPDGWLYGRHGIKQPSQVGRPGTAARDRVDLSCCIWRFHPTVKIFEVVCDGTVNPWGLDFDDAGQAFFSSSVVDHLWHLTPGGHFFRRQNVDAHSDPFVYELMDAACDHLHWNDQVKTTNERMGQGNELFGGGHAHSDAMIYLGDRWPAEYRGSVFLSNIHGRRINRDSFRTAADGHLAAQHEGDFLISRDPWFRAVSMKYGPDGDAYLTDWSDLGECHDRDGVHRTSGRIYKVTWGSPRRVDVDLAKLSNEDLVRLQLHPNDWYVRHARRRLQERAASGEPMEESHQQLKQLYSEQHDPLRRLRLMWALQVTQGTDTKWLISQVDCDSPQVRCWAVRFLSEFPPVESDALSALTRLAAEEGSWTVRMELASAARRIPPVERAPLAWNLATRPTPSEANLERMIWYALEPVVKQDPEGSLRCVNSHLPRRIRRFVTRRVADDLQRHPTLIDSLMTEIDQAETTYVLADMLTGLNASLIRHRPEVSIEQWSEELTGLMDHSGPVIRRAGFTTATALGDDALLEELCELMHQPDLDESICREILERLSVRRPQLVGRHLCRLIHNKQLLSSALQAAPMVDNQELIDLLIGSYGSFTYEQKALAVNALIARASSAMRLMQAMETGVIPTKDLTAQQAVQLAALSDPELTQKLTQVWGTITSTSATRKKQIQELKAALRPDFIVDADLQRGRQFFQEKCAVCHRLFGEGKQIAPDLTGSQRKNLDYLLLNIVDPNATVPADYRLSIIALVDGRVITGCILESSEQTLTVQTTTELLHLRRDDIEETKTLSTSLMPEDLLSGMTVNDVRNLIGYLMSDG